MNIRRILCLMLSAAMLMYAVPSMAEQENNAYKLGDKIDDFTVTLFDGTQITLYELLNEKKAVLLNFWGSWCVPCNVELPFIIEAAEEYGNDVAVLALSGDWDIEEDARKIYESFAGAIPMGMEPNGLMRRVQPDQVWPTSAVIDRNGVLCLVESGAFISTAQILTLFEAYTTEDYSEPVLIEGLPEIQVTKGVSSEALTAALCAAGFGITADNVDDAWPFIPKGEGVAASNTKVQLSEAAAVLSFEAKSGDILSFDYIIDGNEVYDRLVVYVNGKRCDIITGSSNGWMTEIVKIDDAGTARVELKYIRGHKGGHAVEMNLKNARLLSSEEIAGLESGSSVPKPLKGNEYQIELLNENAKRCVVKINGDSLFAYAPTYIINSDEAELEIKLGKDIDERYAALIISNGNMESKGKAVECMETVGDGLRAKLDVTREEIVTMVAFEEDMEVGNSTESDLILFSYESAVSDFIAQVLDLFTSVEESNSVTVEAYYEDGTPFDIPIAKNEALADEQPSEATYVVHYADENGDPVPGVMTQLCDSDTCSVIMSDEQGNSTITKEPYPYEVHVLKAPDGFAPVTDVFTMPEKGGEITIVLKHS